MKKILIMFLLAFPIIIFAVVSFSSTIISYSVPIAVNSLTITKGNDIFFNNVNEETTLEFKIGPEGARDNSFKIHNEEGIELASYNGKTFKSNTELYVNLSADIIENSFKIDKGEISLKVKAKNMGFMKLIIKTVDGEYEGQSDITVNDPSWDPYEIYGVVFDLNELHKDYLFGDKNAIKLTYTYYPKKAPNNLPINEQEEINNSLKEKAENLLLTLNYINANYQNEVISDGRGLLTLTFNKDALNYGASISTKNLVKNASYSFNVNSGYNIYEYDDLFLNTQSGPIYTLNTSIYLLNNIDLKERIVFSNGMKLYGNNYKIDHSNLMEYTNLTEDGKIQYINRFAIEFNGDGSGLYNTHIIGGLDENGLPYENIINVGMIAKNNKDRTFTIENSIIENGRFNITFKGFASSDAVDFKDKATIFNADGLILRGAYLASIELDSQKVNAYKNHSTKVNLSRTLLEYTAIGIVIQNARNEGGINVLNLVEKNGVAALDSNSWRNLDDASGALNMNDFGYILRELKSDKYKDVYFKERKNYYVNPVIMIRGGYVNDSYITVNDEITDEIETLIKKERTANFVEAMHPSIGGFTPFIIYLKEPKYYPKGGS